MISVALDILKNILGVIKNLNLTKEQTIIVVCVLTLSGTVWSTFHYRGEVTRLEDTVKDKDQELKEAKENALVNSNIKELKELKRQYIDKDKEIISLYKKLENLRRLEITRTEIMEDLGEINNTEDACRAFAKSGYPICDY